MSPFNDAADLSAEERRHQVAAILAMGVLRLIRRRRATGEPVPSSPKISGEFSATCLEVSDETVLSVHTG
jgi:hypothetical protein